MLNKDKHRLQLTSLLVRIYRLSGVAEMLGFRGGTAAMLFYGLPRLSVDLDFDLLKKLNKDEEEKLMSEINKLFGKALEIVEVKRKRFTLFWLISYGKGERRLKIEISRRGSESRFEERSWYGVRVPVMVWGDMVANKLMALVDRNKFAARDVFDVWYFLSHPEKGEINYDLVEKRLGMKPKELYEQILARLEDKQGKDLLQGLGELVEEKEKNWIRNRLKGEVEALVKMRMDQL